MAKDQRGPAIKALDESENLRSYWVGVDEDASEWLFEAVEDAGKSWAVKQLVIEPDGTEHRYSWEALEDEWGFLTDQPLPADEPELGSISRDEFLSRWRD
jgi:hypothetical protein